MQMTPPDTTMAALLDPAAHAAWARQSGSLSPESIRQALADWASHLALSPGKQLDLLKLAGDEFSALTKYLRQGALAGPGAPAGAAPSPVSDRRFAAPEWQRWPFNLWHQAFLLRQNWWEQAARGVWGVSPHHEEVVSFMLRQWLDIFSPGNQLWSNPTVLQRTIDEGGANLARGATALANDIRAKLSGAAPAGADQFRPGEQVAVTPGKVVYRNRLIELIRYAPATAQVHPEPILIVPAWIMKYYILDLSPHNSLIRYLVEQGHTVFCISWKNPGIAERELDMDDYLELGFHAALAQVNAAVPEQRVHLAGYCLGGTLSAIAAAAMARDGDERLASLTLFAAQTDLSEPGELGLFIDESQVSLLEAQMDQAGFLKAEQMAGAFQMLRSYDLLWSRMVNQYLLGEAEPMNDLMAWNADTTRMPARMHSQYLRRLFLHNDLSEGRYPVGGKPVALNDLTLPLFCVGTETDHVAPWRSVYKLHYETPAELTFVLTSGGHNAGIVSEPGHPHRHYRIHTRAHGQPYVGTDAWQAAATPVDGSWWPAWTAWLQARSGPAGAPPPFDRSPALADAPGSYVKEA